MQQRSDEGAKDVMAFQTLVPVSIQHQVMEALDTVENVSDAMIRIVLKVAKRDLAGEVYQVVERNVVQVKEVLGLENFECEEL